MTEIWNLSSLCRCCHSDGTFKSLYLSYEVKGQREQYAVMLKDTFGIVMDPAPPNASAMVCDDCIYELKKATRFKAQVLDCERKFAEYCLNEQTNQMDVKIECESEDNSDAHGNTDDWPSSCKIEVDINIKPKQEDSNSDLFTSVDVPSETEDIKKDVESVVQKNEKQTGSVKDAKAKKGVKVKDMDLTPDFIKQEARTEVENLLTPKSKQRYLKSYHDFMKWRAEKKVKSLSENVLLIYFNELSKTYKPSTLWSVYSMLKTTLSTKHNVHLKNFERLTSFIKRQSDGFKSKKSKVFTSQEVETFLNEAPDEIYLAMKVVLILAISGACRSIELLNMKVDDIEKQGDIFLVKLRGTKTKVDRTFVIKKEFVNIIEKYQKLRPSGIETNRFFINYVKGKCLRQVIGKNKFSSIPKEIATYLNLPNSNLYSGHCFRRTSATLLANSRVIKRHGRWKSSKVADGYIEESVENKTKI